MSAKEPSSTVVPPPISWNLDRRFVSEPKEFVPNRRVLPPMVWDLDCRFIPKVEEFRSGTLALPPIIWDCDWRENRSDSSSLTTLGENEKKGFDAKAKNHTSAYPLYVSVCRRNCFTRRSLASLFRFGKFGKGAVHIGPRVLYKSESGEHFSRNMPIQ